MTYNCRFERRERPCERMIQAFDEHPALELVASERWEGKEVRLYRFK
jgi:hypothetical protein